MLRSIRKFRGAAPTAALTLTALLTLALGGCNTTQFGGELADRPVARPLSQGGAARALSLPADEPFSIRTFQSSQNAALEGTADASAAIVGADGATAAATVKGGGDASGGFQLGHALVNEGSVQVDLRAAVSLRYSYKIEVEQLERRPVVSIALNFFARDGVGRVITSTTWVQHTADEGAAESTGSKNFTLPVTLGPGQSVSLWVAGQALVTAQPGFSGTAELTLADLKFEIESRPAPVPASASAPAAIQR